MQAKVTKMVCPSCEGVGYRELIGMKIVCAYCRGEDRCRVDMALKYADWVYVIAGGGYLAGDHSYETMREYEAKAEKIYAMAMVKPPWKAVA